MFMICRCRKFQLLAFATALVVLSPTGLAQAVPITFSASGVDAASIQATVDAFRADLGSLNPNVVGSLGTGRREINWDGVPDNFSAPNLLPNDFFNVNSPRGTVYSTPGTGVAVSANAANGGQYDLAISTRLTPVVSSVQCTEAIHCNQFEHCRCELFCPGDHGSRANSRLCIRFHPCGSSGYNLVDVLWT